VTIEVGTKQCNDIVSYEFLWTCRALWLYLVECSLHALYSSNNRVRVMVRIRFSVWLVSVSY